MLNDLVELNAKLSNTSYKGSLLNMFLANVYSLANKINKLQFNIKWQPDPNSKKNLSLKAGYAQQIECHF